MSLKNNPLIHKSTLKYGAVPFDAIKQEHYIPALDYAIKLAEEKLDEIKNNSNTPTFKNTSLPLETSNELMETVVQTYFNIMQAESDNDFKELAQEISPKISILENNKLLSSTNYLNLNFYNFEFDKIF